MKSQGFNTEAKVESKGVHILSICDARSEKAQEFQGLIEKVGEKYQGLKKASLNIEIEKLQALKNQNWQTLKFCQDKLEALEKMMMDLWQENRYHLEKLHKGFLTQQFYVENITTTVGRNVFARRLSGNNTYTGNVSHTALGTNNTAPVVGDTQLNTETYRKALSSGAYANNIAYIETFYTASEVSGTFQEYGNFIDGSGSANSGQLFNRFLQTVTKSVTETLNVQSTVTFADA